MGIFVDAYILASNPMNATISATEVSMEAYWAGDNSRGCDEKLDFDNDITPWPEGHYACSKPRLLAWANLPALTRSRFLRSRRSSLS